MPSPHPAALLLTPISLLALLLAGPAAALAHDPAHPNEPHPPYDFSVQPPGAGSEPGTLLAQAGPAAGAQLVRAEAQTPAQAAAFTAFAPQVKVRWDARSLFVESNGMPSHKMMVGITAWQQQVPLPQDYTGANAWAIPLQPVPAKVPLSIKGRFLRGAIALAANGIPIFNPQNNRGEISAEIGELDQWGGHCGRADDYHYHAAPLHLQSVLGPGLPIAYALDGYPLYGLTEPDGSAPAGLDAFNGHTTPALGYHYHASTKYPYVNGGFHGEVVEREQQVDPQPRAQPVRPALPPLRGAKITGFESNGKGSYQLIYDLAGEKRAVSYTVTAEGVVPFEFQNGSQGTTKETYTRRDASGPPPGGDRPPRAGEQRPPRDPAPAGAAIGMDAMKKPLASFVLTSPEFADGGQLPGDYTGDGSGATPPLAWKGAPAGTQSYALVMDHLAPGNVVKSYWTMWDLPATTTSLPKNVKGIGRLGTSFKGAIGYEPPHSQGPGPKTYVLTIYALSAPPQIAQSPREVTREILLGAIRDKVLASASLSVVSTREGGAATERRPPAVGELPPPRDPARPNFLVIIGEAQGWSSSSVQMDDAVPASKSDFVRTPNLEKLAAGGMRFADFYAASPRCTPTRAAFFTGRSPAALRMTFVGEGLGGRESSFSETGSKLIPAASTSELPEAETTIAEVLKRAGYATAHFGKWHVGRVSPAQHGFEENDGPNNNGGPENVENPNPKQAFATAELGMAFLAREAKAGKPFYLQISHYAGRGGTDARPETYAALRQRAKTDRDLRLIGAAAVREDMDATIGMLLAKLDELGLAGRTYVIYTADHGAQGPYANEPLTNGKGTVWEGGLRVPLLVRGPGIKPGSCAHLRASTVDLFPTMAALAGVREPMPANLEGGSLAPVLAGALDATVSRPREEFVVHFPHYDRIGQGPASALLLGNYKLIRSYETGASHLYDLAKDPGEQHDLALAMARETAALGLRLTQYLAAMHAAMPAPNPKFDPAHPRVFQERGGGQGRTSPDAP